MEVKKRILVLCGGKFAFQALQLLAYEKYLCGVGIGKGSEIIVDALERETEESQLAFKSFPNKKSMAEMRSWIDSIQPDYIFSIAFPFLLPQEVLSYGEKRFINFHLGLLPQYRGAMPIFEVIKNQEDQTAICVHFMNEYFDEGEIIFNEIINIDKNDTYGKLAVKMSKQVTQTAINVAEMVQYSDTILSKAQDEKEAYYHEKPQLSDTYIKWKRMEASEIMALINACNPWNIGADASFLGQQIKIVSASLIEADHGHKTPGTILEIVEGNTINVACSDNRQIAIEIISTDEGIMTAKQMLSKSTMNLSGLVLN